MVDILDGEVTDLTVIEPREMLAETLTPEGTVSLATRMATALKDIVERQKLYAIIQGRKYPQVEAWMTIARMDNVVAREVLGGVTHNEDGSWEAVVELVRLSDGMVIGRGSALCGTPEDEPWGGTKAKNGRSALPPRSDPAKRSMAVTRATSRAFRQQYCPAPDQLVLTADLRWVRAGSLRVGDELIGFDKDLGPSMHYRRSVVTAAEDSGGELIEIATDLGTTIVSDGHPLVRLRDKRAAVWTHAENIVPGDRLAFMMKPFAEDTSFDAGWMAGFLDGEGSVNAKLGVYVGQKAGPIADTLVADARSLGFELRTHARKGEMTNFTVYGGMEAWLTFLGRVRPRRLLAKASVLWEDRNAMRRRRSAVVQSVRRLGMGAIIAIETSTETLIVDGFLGHNSWIMALAGYEPTPAEEMPRDDQRPIGAHDTPPDRPELERLAENLIGTVEEGKPPVDLQLRQTPEGPAWGFKLKAGNKGYQALAIGPLAETLALLPDLQGQQVRVWGRIEMIPWRKNDKDMPPYARIAISRVQTDELDIPAQEAETVPLGLVPDDDISDLPEEWRPETIVDTRFRELEG